MLNCSESYRKSVAAAGRAYHSARSWCAPCFGQAEDALPPGQRAITSFNRNWQNRMGYGGEGFLASPSVVAAPAMLGHTAGPEEFGIQWDADTFAV